MALVLFDDFDRTGALVGSQANTGQTWVNYPDPVYAVTLPAECIDGEATYTGTPSYTSSPNTLAPDFVADLPADWFRGELSLGYRLYAKEFTSSLTYGFDATLANFLPSPPSTPGTYGDFRSFYNADPDGMSLYTNESSGVFGSLVYPESLIFPGYHTFRWDYSSTLLDDDQPGVRMYVDDAEVGEMPGVLLTEGTPILDRLYCAFSGADGLDLRLDWIALADTVGEGVPPTPPPASDGFWVVGAIAC